MDTKSEEMAASVDVQAPEKEEKGELDDDIAKKPSSNSNTSTNEDALFVFVDFELTYANKKLKKSAMRPQLDSELDQLVAILPVIQNKITNLNQSEYIEDMSDASGTLWLDVGKRDWSDQLLAVTGLTRSHMPG